MQFIMDNYTEILAALGAFYALATAVATITPTDKDNTLLDKIGKFADRVGLKLK